MHKKTKTKIAGIVLMWAITASAYVIGYTACNQNWSVKLELKKPVEVHEVAPCAEGYNEE